MKKILVLSLLLLATPVFAGQTAVKTYTLKDTTGTAVTSYLLSSGNTLSTDKFPIDRNKGFASLIVTENKSGGAGSVNIYAEYSTDGTTWYRPYNSDMAGTITIEGNIVTSLQNVSRWVIFTPRLAPFVRITFVATADSQITASLIYQEDR